MPHVENPALDAGLVFFRNYRKEEGGLGPEKARPS